MSQFMNITNENHLNSMLLYSFSFHHLVLKYILTLVKPKSFNFSGFAGRRPAKSVLKQGTQKICHHDGRRGPTPHLWALNFRFGPFFLDSETCQIFSCLKKFFSHYQLSSPVRW